MKDLIVMDSVWLMHPFLILMHKKLNERSH